MAAGGPRLLDLRSGGWLLLLTALLVLLVGVWLVPPLFRSDGGAIGDGIHVESYGFDLRDALVREIVAAGLPRDGVPSLDHPEIMAAEEVAVFNQAHRGKYLVSDDRVIGVELNGERRAYPIRVLNWHEVVNDTLGGVPVAVTYHPLCDSVVVFDRRVDGEPYVFGVSGLLHNSNLLMYDRSSGPRGESLWSQLQARAIAGPAAARQTRLNVLPASVARWSHWRERFPDTTVIRPALARLKRYQRNPYGNYFVTQSPRFPVDPLPPEGSLPLMTRLFILERDGHRWLVPLEGDDLEGSVALRDWPDLEVEDAGQSASVILAAGPGARSFHSMWFAWYAHHPDGALEDLRRSRESG